MNIHTVLFPDIGEGVVEGEIVEWLKQEGDAVKKNEPVLIAMTDKATVELPSPYEGTIVKHHYQVGQTAKKNTPLYDVQLSSSTTPLNPETNTATTTTEYPPTSNTPASPPISKRHDHALAIPHVRHLAHDLNIDIDTITGTGKDGRVTAEDLKKHVESSYVAAVASQSLKNDEKRPLAGIRGAMARRMDALRLPQFSYFEQVDATHLIQLQHHIKQEAAHEGIHLSYMPFFIRALSLTIEMYPEINSSIDMQQNMLTLHQHRNIGIAIATPQGLIVPVIKEVEKMTFEQIIKSYETLKAKTLEGKLAPEELKGGTITISNFGILGEGMWATPMVMPPEVAILGIAKIRKGVVPKGDQSVVKDILPLSWSFDHRVIDGQQAAAISHSYCLLLRDAVKLL